MLPKHDITLVLYYRKTGKYPHNVLAGALETRVSTRAVHIAFPTTPPALAAAIEEACGQSRHVVVGWSFYSTQFPDVCAELRQVRARITDARVVHVAGGVHATAEPEQTLRAGFDLVAVGEGEQIIVDLMNSLLAGHDVTTVRGVAYLNDGEFERNGKGAHIDLDDYPPCAPRYRRFGPIEITRGCVYGCKFCQTPFVNKARFRHRSVDTVRHYAGVMCAYGHKDFRFITPSALSYGTSGETPNLAAIEALLDAVRSAAGKQARIFFGTFPSEVRPEHVTREALALLKRYVDNDNLIIGGQSGSQRMLDASHRGHTVEAVITAVRLAVEAGFRPNVDFLFGMPGETAEDADATRRLAQRLADMGARIHSHTFMPLPGTPFRAQAPGRVDALTQQELERLESQGKAYGQWRDQMDIAEVLAAAERRR